jgi:heat shock protein HslJ
MATERDSTAFVILLVLIALLVVIGGVALLALGLLIPVESNVPDLPEDTFTFTGIATHVDLEGGFWGFIADDGTRYFPVNFPPYPQLQEGDRVEVTAFLVDVSTIQMWGIPIRVIQLSVLMPETQSLTRDTWVLDAMRENQTLTPVPTGVRVTLKFSDEENFGGKAPVNLYFGKYTVNNTAVQLSQIGSTFMAGTPERMALEARYYSLLEEIRSFEIEELRLELKDDEGAVLLVYHGEAVFT